MVCKKCNFQNPNGMQYCGGCGAPLYEKKSSKKNWLIAALAVALVAVAVVIILMIFGSSGAAEVSKEQLELGYQYISNGNYEEAILAFDKVIEVDDKNVDAYIGKATAQSNIIDENTAQNVSDTLVVGYEKTNDDRIIDAFCVIADDLNESGHGEIAVDVIANGNAKLQNKVLLDYYNEIKKLNEDANYLTPIAEIEWQGHSYHVYDDVMSWEEANDYCEKAGGNLVTISSPEEQEVVASLAASSSRESCWIGGYKDTEWHWVTGEGFLYTNWAYGEPNGGDDVYAQIYTNKTGNESVNYFWDDTWNNGDLGGGITKQGFICEWNSEQQLDLTEPSDDDVQPDENVAVPEIADGTGNDEDINDVTNGVDNYDKIIDGDFSAIAGVWKYPLGSTVTLLPSGIDSDSEEDPEYEYKAEYMEKMENGSYFWNIMRYDNGRMLDGIMVTFYPEGVEVVDWNKKIIETDITKPRLWIGSGSVASRSGADDIMYKE